MAAPMHGIIAFALGIGLALFLYPTDFLLGSLVYWEHIEGDTAINWIAYMAFAYDDWRWPLLRTVLLYPPAGANIYFADSIPLLALVGKLIFKTTGFLPNYFGPWVLVSYGLQCGVGYWAFRQARLTPWASLAGGVLCLLVPTFIFRIGHLPLLGHWALLAAIGIYLRIVEQGRRSDLGLGLAFTMLLVLVNPYLLVMAIAIYLAGLGDAVARGSVKLRHAVACGALVFAGVLGLAVLFGLVNPSRSLSIVGGFGHFSMNVLSPIWPQVSGWPIRSGVILDASGGQYEGFNYLGAGLLLLVALALLTSGKVLLQGARRHVFLAVAMLLMAVYALSSKIYVGQSLLVTLPYDSVWPLDVLTGVFRASGRFFWPMCYGLVFLSASALFIQFKERRFLAIVLIVVVVQLINIRPLLDNVSGNIAGQASTPKEPVDRSNWKAALRLHDELIVFPQYSCAKFANRAYILELGKMAASLRMPANSTLDNRADVDCAAEALAFTQDFRALATRPNPIVVSFKNETNPALVRQASAAGRLVCVENDVTYVCTGPDSAAAVAHLGRGLSSPPVLSSGEVVGFKPGDRGQLFLQAGWSSGAADYVWGYGPTSSLAFVTAEPVCGPAVISLTVRPFSVPTFIVDHALVTVNGSSPTPVRASGPGQFTLDIPVVPAECRSLFTVALSFSELRSPLQLGFGRDSRLLNWALISYSISW